MSSFNYDAWKALNPREGSLGECRKCYYPFDVDKLSLDSLCPHCKTMTEPKPTYVCWKCGKGSWQNGGRPICCYCGAKGQIEKEDAPDKNVKKPLSFTPQDDNNSEA